MNIYIGTVELENFSIIKGKYYEKDSIYGNITFSKSEQPLKANYFKIVKGLQSNGAYIEEKSTIEIYYVVETNKPEYVFNGNIKINNF